MSEKATAKPAAAKEAKKSDTVKGREAVQKDSKVKWTLQRCQKYARRYTTENAWSSSAISSYKAAVAHGWKEECLGQMGKTTNSTSFKKAA